MEKQKINGWKVTAIIFICLFAGLLILNIWAVASVINDEEETNQCYYNVCSEYIEATYDEGICRCYNINSTGEYELVKTEYFLK